MGTAILFAAALWPVAVQQAPPASRAHVRAVSAAAISTASEEKLRTAFDHLYNLDFNAGHQLLREVAAAEPESATAQAFVASALLYEILARQGTLQSQLFVTSNEFLRQKREPPEPDLKQRFLRAAEQTETLAQNRLKQNPQDVDGLFALGLTYAAQANFTAGVLGEYVAGVRLGEKAYDAHKKLRELYPEIHDVGVVLGVRNYVIGSLPRMKRFLLFFLGAHGDREEGLEDLREAAEHGEYLRTYARVLLTVAWIREEKLDQAVGALEALRIRYPRNPLFPFELGRLYRQQGRYPEAARVLQELAADLTAHPHNPRILGPEDAWLELGRVQAASGDLEPALESFRRAARVEEAKQSARAWAWLEQGRVHDQRGEREQALASYQEAARLDEETEVTELARRYQKKPYHDNHRKRD